MAQFLKAEWRHLLMLNYPVKSELLEPHVPRGVQLDTWNGEHYVSMVGFLFLRTRVMGLPIPFHINFAEVNLRFYVRRQGPEGWRRGVVFIKEIVPRQLIATVARVCYNEPYIALPMRHEIECDNNTLTNGSLVKYQWHQNGSWSTLAATVAGPPETFLKFRTRHSSLSTIGDTPRNEMAVAKNTAWNMRRGKSCPPGIRCCTVISLLFTRRNLLPF